MGIFGNTQKKKAEVIKLVSDNIAFKYDIKIIYIKVQCSSCQKQFGVSPNYSNEISEADLICTKCLREKMFEK